MSQELTYAVLYDSLALADSILQIWITFTFAVFCNALVQPLHGNMHLALTRMLHTPADRQILLQICRVSGARLKLTVRRLRVLQADPNSAGIGRPRGARFLRESRVPSTRRSSRDISGDQFAALQHGDHILFGLAFVESAQAVTKHGLYWQIETADIAAVHALAVRHAIKVIQPPTLAVWGRRTMTLGSPCGYTVGFEEA